MRRSTILSRLWCFTCFCRDTRIFVKHRYCLPSSLSHNYTVSAGFCKLFLWFWCRTMWLDVCAVYLFSVIFVLSFLNWLFGGLLVYDHQSLFNIRSAAQDLVKYIGGLKASFLPFLSDIPFYFCCGPFTSWKTWKTFGKSKIFFCHCLLEQLLMSWLSLSYIIDAPFTHTCFVPVAAPPTLFQYHCSDTPSPLNTVLIY